MDNEELIDLYKDIESHIEYLQNSIIVEEKEKEYDESVI